MCGIVGRVGEGPPTAIDELALASLYHRGPDEGGAWHGDGVFLGIRRLSIIDLVGGQQPMWDDASRWCIVYNGELYNFLDLRAELEATGHRFRTRSDTEVVLHSYMAWGPECLRRFNGMFALAIWDVPQHRLFLARDRIGEKPLYYYEDGRRLVFASEIKAILADPSIPRRLNPRGLANFLAFGHAVAPETMFDGIRKLLPGHYLVSERGRIKAVQYWDVGHHAELRWGEALGEHEYAERILHLLDDSVRRRLIADVPVGAFLSGGVDSSAVVALMMRHASARIKTFSLGHGVGRAYSELPDARQVARHFGTEHHELQVDHADLLKHLTTLVYHYDEPFGDAAGFNVYVLSRLAREHVKVVLTGEGGDELFGGYRRFTVEQIAPLYQRLPRLPGYSALLGLVSRLPRLRRLKKVASALSVADPALRYAAWMVFFSSEMRAELLRPGMLDELGAYDPRWSYLHYYRDGAVRRDHLNRLMYVDLKTWLSDMYLEKVDKATMAVSLEARLPILDHRLVELAFQIPSRFKVRGVSTKRVFKRALARMLPGQVLRKPKHGFTVPTDAWFRGELKQFAFDVLMDDRVRRRGYFDQTTVERLWLEHAHGRHVLDSQLWLLLTFELWARTYLDGDGATCLP